MTSEEIRKEVNTNGQLGSTSRGKEGALWSIAEMVGEVAYQLALMNERSLKPEFYPPEPE